MRLGAALLACLLTGAFAPAASADDGDWSRRWRRAERALTEADLSRVTISLTSDQVLLSLPYVPSHCSEDEMVADGLVTALDRRTGAYRWHAIMPQASGDQNAFLSSYRWADRIVFATNGILTAFDHQGRRRWQAHAADQPEPCRGGPADWQERSDVHQEGRHLLWPGRDGHTCTLDLRTGRARPTERAAPAATAHGDTDPVTAPARPDGRDVHILGADADAAGAVTAYALCSPGNPTDCQVHVRAGHSAR